MTELPQPFTMSQYEAWKESNKPSFHLAFVCSYVRRMHENLIIRETDNGVQITKHNGKLGRDYREIGEPLIVRRDYLGPGRDKLQWARFTAYRIDLWVKGEPDPDEPDNWYARELLRTKDNAPA